jgi:hypothetical protein
MPMCESETTGIRNKIVTPQIVFYYDPKVSGEEQIVRLQAMLTNRYHGIQVLVRPKPNPS